MAVAQERASTGGVQIPLDRDNATTNRALALVSGEPQALAFRLWRLPDAAHGRAATSGGFGLARVGRSALATAGIAVSAGTPRPSAAR